MSTLAEQSKDQVVNELGQTPPIAPSLDLWFGLELNKAKEASLKKLIAARFTEPNVLRTNFLHEIWLKQLLEIDRRAHGYKSMYIMLRAVAIVGSILLPVFTLYSDKLSIVLASVIVAISAGWEALYRYGEKWQLFRRMSLEMESLGVIFLQKSRIDNMDHENFVRKVMGVIKKKAEGYNDIVEQSLPNYTEIQEAINKSGLENVKKSTDNGKNPLLQEDKDTD